MCLGNFSRGSEVAVLLCVSAEVAGKKEDRV